MNFTDDPIPLWSPNFTEYPDEFNSTTLDIRLLETFLVMPVSAAGKGIGESVVEVIDEAITTLVVEVMVVMVLAVVAATALVVVLVRRRRRRRLAAKRGAETQGGENVEGETALEMTELVEVSAPAPATLPAEESALVGGAGCEDVSVQSGNSQPE